MNFFKKHKGTLIGAALAPFTGGLSLTAGAAYDVSKNMGRKMDKQAAEFQAELDAAGVGQGVQQFVDPRKGPQSALSQFSVNPRQGRQGRASNIGLMSGMQQFPSLLR